MKCYLSSEMFITDIALEFLFNSHFQLTAKEFTLELAKNSFA